MLEEESGAAHFGLPEEVLVVLPSDPFEQLDVARKITSIALSTRISALESETAALLAQLSDKDALIAELQSQIESLDAALAEKSDKLAHADEEKESLLQENASLADTVKKLNRDVSKLEVFRKTLMQSLQDEESSTGASEVNAKKIQRQASVPTAPQVGDDLMLPPPRYSSVQSQTSEMVNSIAEDHVTDGSRPRISKSLLLASQTNTPRLTPPGSPPMTSASGSPTRTSQPVSPRRHSMSFSVSRGMFDKPSMFSSIPSNDQSSASSPYAGPHTGRTRVDGKEFFRQVSTYGEGCSTLSVSILQPTGTSTSTLGPSFMVSSLEIWQTSYGITPSKLFVGRFGKKGMPESSLKSFILGMKSGTL